MANGGLLDAGIMKRGGANAVNFTNNIKLESVTTTHTRDTIRITGIEGSLLASRPGYIMFPDMSNPLAVTADVDILLTGAHWNMGGTGDLTGFILRVIALDDGSGTVKFGVSMTGNRKRIPTSDTDTTASNVNLPDELIVDSSLSAEAWAVDIGYFRADFDDTGGAVEDLWQIQNGTDDVALGSADGLISPYNFNYAGFSSDPSGGVAEFTQVGGLCHVSHRRTAGTSNATNLDITLPLFSNAASDNTILVVDNGTTQNSAGLGRTGASSQNLQVYKNLDETVFTGSGSKNATFALTYQVEGF
jgi:hypothetical protein